MAPDKAKPMPSIPMKWSESIVKTRVDASIFEETEKLSHDDRAVLNDLSFWCEGVFQSEERIEKVRKKVLRARDLTEASAAAIREIADQVLEELREIEEDLKFAQSRRGRFILFANDYGQELYGDLRKVAALDEVMVGSHPEREELVVSGRVEAAEHLSQLASLIAEHPPGVPIRFELVLDLPNDT